MLIATTHWAHLIYLILMLVRHLFPARPEYNYTKAVCLLHNVGKFGVYAMKSIKFASKPIFIQLSLY